MRWEYRFVTLASSAKNKDRWQWVVSYTAQSEENAVFTDANDYLNWLGSQGFELVTCGPQVVSTGNVGTSYSPMCLVFKRPQP